MRWQEKLNAEDLNHLKRWGVRSIKGLKRTRAFQGEQRKIIVKAGLPDREICYECSEIAIKLGVEK